MRISEQIHRETCWMIFPVWRILRETGPLTESRHNRLYSYYTQGVDNRYYHLNLTLCWISMKTQQENCISIQLPKSQSVVNPVEPRKPCWGENGCHHFMTYLYQSSVRKKWIPASTVITNTLTDMIYVHNISLLGNKMKIISSKLNETIQEISLLRFYYLS